MTATNVTLAVPYALPTTIGGAGGIFWGEGAPTFAAAKGSLYVNYTAASTTTRLYVNTDGSTTWAYFTASA